MIEFGICFGHTLLELPKLNLDCIDRRIGHFGAIFILPLFLDDQTIPLVRDINRTRSTMFIVRHSTTANRSMVAYRRLIRIVCIRLTLCKPDEIVFCVRLRISGRSCFLHKFIKSVILWLYITAQHALRAVLEFAIRLGGNLCAIIPSTIILIELIEFERCTVQMNAIVLLIDLIHCQHTITAGRTAISFFQIRISSAGPAARQRGGI